MKIDIEKMVDCLDLTIDENNLPNNWKEQAGMMLTYGMRFADAQQEEAEAKATLDVIRAGLDRDIRAEPDAFDVAKPTETAVANAVLLQPEHAAATTNFNDARHKVGVLRAAVDAISHRKSALQGMTDLFLRQWYADPTSKEQPPELREAATSGSPMGEQKGRRTRRVKSNK